MIISLRLVLSYPYTTILHRTTVSYASVRRLWFIQNQQAARFCISNLFGLSAYVTISFIVNSGFL